MRRVQTVALVAGLVPLISLAANGCGSRASTESSPLSSAETPCQKDRALEKDPAAPFRARSNATLDRLENCGGLRPFRKSADKELTAIAACLKEAGFPSSSGKRSSSGIEKISHGGPAVSYVERLTVDTRAGVFWIEMGPTSLTTYDETAVVQATGSGFQGGGFTDGSVGLVAGTFSGPGDFSPAFLAQRREVASCVRRSSAASGPHMDLNWHYPVRIAQRAAGSAG